MASTKRCRLPKFERVVRSVLETSAFQNQFNPIAELLVKCEREWDGQPRIDTMFIRHLGAEDTPLTRAFTRAFLIAMVRRARKPGCDFYQMPVLEELAGGAGKGTLLRALAGEDYYASGVQLDAEAKEFIERTRGVWLLEASELVGLNRPNRYEEVKEAMQRTHDRARVAYGRTSENVPRSFVLVGSSNKARYLPPGEGGERRFAPIRLDGRRIDLDTFLTEREQILGEAAHYESQGEIHNTSPNLWKDEVALRDKRVLVDALEDDLRPLLDSLPGGYLPARQLRVFCSETGEDYARLHRTQVIFRTMQRLGFLPGEGRYRGGFVKGRDTTLIDLESLKRQLDLANARSDRGADKVSLPSTRERTGLTLIGGGADAVH